MFHFSGPLSGRIVADKNTNFHTIFPHPADTKNSYAL